MTREDTTRRVIAAAERLHDTADGLRHWAASYLPGTIPAPLQRVIDAADYYAAQLNEYPREQIGPSTQHRRKETSPNPDAAPGDHHKSKQR